MSPALIAAFAWLAGANVIAMLPSKHHHWPSAMVLIAIGVPLTVWLHTTVGLVATLLFALAAGSVLRWPLIFAVRWVRGHLG